MKTILDPEFSYVPSHETDIRKRFRREGLATNLALLAEIQEFLENHSDVIDGQDGPRPNTAMNLLRELEAMIKRLKENA